MIKEFGKLILVFGVGVVLGVSVAGLKSTPPEPQSNKEHETASTMIDLGDDIVVCDDQSVANEASAFALLEGCTEENDLELDVEDYGDMGILVTAIGGKENGTNDQFWQYWVNNRYATIGSQDYAVSGGDTILWNYTSSIE